MTCVELIPIEQLHEGKRVEIEEDCEKCKERTNHEYVLRSVTPRFWTYRCTRCRSRSGESLAL